MDRALSLGLDCDITDHNACHAASLDLGSFSPRREGFRVEHTHDPVVPRTCTGAREESQTVYRLLVIGIVHSRVRVSQARGDQDPTGILDFPYSVRAHARYGHV